MIIPSMESILHTSECKFSLFEFWTCIMSTSNDRRFQTSLRACIICSMLPFDIAENLQQFFDKAEYHGKHLIYTTSPEQKTLSGGQSAEQREPGVPPCLLYAGDFFEPKLLARLSHTTDTAVVVASVSPDARGYCMTLRRLMKRSIIGRHALIHSVLCRSRYATISHKAQPGRKCYHVPVGLATLTTGGRGGKVTQALETVCCVLRYRR